MARAQGARSQLALAFESTYGTAPASGFTKLPFVTNGLSSQQPLVDSDLLGFGRDPLAPIKDAVTADGDIVIPVGVDDIGFWLKAAFGAPVTTGTTPKTHTYKSGGLVIPSLAIEIGTPETPNYSMFAGCVLDQLEFRMQRAGNLQATARVVAQGETRNTASQAGTIAALAQIKRFGHFQGAIKRNTVALANIVTADFTYSNNLDRVETIRADGKIDGADPTIAAMTGSLTARFADTTLLDAAAAGTSSALEFSWTISANESLTITVHEVYLPVPRRSIEGPGGIQVTFDWQAALNTVATCMVTAVLKNAVAAY